MPSYQNPITFADFQILIALKLFFIVLYRFVSETLSWVLLYIGTALIALLYLAAVVQFPYSKENLDILSDELENPWYLFYSFINIPLYYIVIYACGISMIREEKYFIIGLWELILWLSFIFLAIIDFCHYVLGIEIITFFYVFVTQSLFDTGETVAAPVPMYTPKPFSLLGAFPATTAPPVVVGGTPTPSPTVVSTPPPLIYAKFLPDFGTKKFTVPTPTPLGTTIAPITTMTPYVLEKGGDVTTTPVPATTTYVPVTTTMAPTTTTYVPVTTTMAPTTTTPTPSATPA